MKYIRLHTKNTSIVYKNSICSFASSVVLLLLILSILVPIILVSFLSPYTGIAESRILYEQPKVRFQHKYLFYGETIVGNGDIIACSTFSYFNFLTKDFQKCGLVKFVAEHKNHDRILDRANFELVLDTPVDGPGLKNLNIVLFFEAFLKYKCNLQPTAILTHSLQILENNFRAGEITVKGRMVLFQNSEFRCPFYGRSEKSHFFDEILLNNATNARDFSLETIREKFKSNSGYFELEATETYVKRARTRGIRIKFLIDIIEIPVRYNLNVWERLGQFWLYFASFFGISFYVLQKCKDYLFSRHILRSWEIIPWKKLY